MTGDHVCDLDYRIPIRCRENAFATSTLNIETQHPERGYPRPLVIGRVRLERGPRKGNLKLAPGLLLISFLDPIPASWDFNPIHANHLYAVSSSSKGDIIHTFVSIMNRSMYAMLLSKVGTGASHH